MRRNLYKESAGVMIGGGVATLARFFIAFGMKSKAFPLFPLPILVVNLSGCFLIGAAFALFKNNLSPFLKNLIFVGFLAGYTTFSDFSFDTNSFFLNSQIGMGLLNIGASVAGGFLLFVGGYTLGLWISQKNKKKT